MKPDVRADVNCVWNVMAHGDSREGKRRGNWRMEWVASTLTLPRNMVHPALIPLMRKPRLPVVEWTDAIADLNLLVRFPERRILVSVRVPSHFKRSLQLHPFLLSALNGSESSVSRLQSPRHPSSRKMARPQNTCEYFVDKEIQLPHSVSISPYPSHYTDWNIPTLGVDELLY